MLCFWVSQLGEELLWVDSLCIVQDDELAKHHMIHDMASIYDQAIVTIIDVHGQNAGNVLHRVLSDDNIPEIVAKFNDDDLYLAVRQPLKKIMSLSVYNTRAWTFQERLLSRRCLYFTKYQVFFECQCELWSEDRLETLSNSSTTSQAEPSASGSLMKKDLAAFGDPLDTTEELRLRRYSSIVEEYCDKQLTFSMDILDAFAGIGAVMAQLCSWNMVRGLPKELLDRALLWKQGNHTSVRVSNST
jgi:hypothetical protein